jgi:hypothetical protein
MEREGKQEEDAYPEETARQSAYPRGGADDGASDAASPEENEPELAPGALTLALRSDHVRTLVGLELPVYSTNMERVLETVGGMDVLQQTHEAKSQFLPVKLRPSEPSCKPLFADLTKTQTILLRMRRKKIPPTEEVGVANGSIKTKAPAKFRFEGHVVGLVKEKYVCEGMADFQYFAASKFYPDPVSSGMTTRSAPLAVGHPSPNAGGEGTAGPVPPVGSVMPPDAVSTYAGSKTQLAIKASLRPYLRVTEERELEMVPEVFSKVDLPLKYEFRQRSGYQPTEAAKKPSKTMTYLNFHDDTPAPAAPKPDNPVIRRRPVGSNENVDDDVLRILQEKLAQKPVWLRPKLFVGLDFMERRAARRILRKLCYVFVDGPWRGSWIRMGYDPRTTTDSAKYQVIELRNNRELVHAKVTHPSRKRTKKYSGINPKGPRIAKVTQTSEHENSQANKRRRKERFLRGETRRSYLVDPNEQSYDVPGSPDPSVTSTASASNTNGGDRSVAEWDSDNDDEYEAMELDDGKHTDEERASSSSAANHTSNSGSGGGDKIYEIFGVPLTSANVLFQLDEIDHEEVNAWIAQFQHQEKPTLLGGWYSTHMFLPLREIIRYRIAALVGRSKAELETRRKRIEALKKQALSDYADQLAGREPSNSKKAREIRKNKANGTASAESQDGDTGTAGDRMEEADGDSAEQEDEPMEDEATALEVSLAVSRATQNGSTGRQKRKTTDAGQKAIGERETEVAVANEEDEDEEEEEEEGFQDDDAAEVAAHGRLQSTGHKGTDDDEEDDEDDDEEEEEEEEEEANGQASESGHENGNADQSASVATSRPVEYSF